MNWLRDIKFGILFGLVGFTLTLLTMYSATGILDWRFPAVIGTGFFGGGFLGSLMRRLYKGGEERKANLILLVCALCLIPVIIENLYDVFTGNWRTWKAISVVGGVYLICFAIFRVARCEDEDCQDKSQESLCSNQNSWS
ncbi:hypothetical protein Asulf_01915 [Archaeoglobus sulfaticallidus PM70-1]|uniref:Uncharacterized protein n=1 Tax=Archaeoglobus sulfaticallidus PM70-1 TaxID=387631 RepID=N0BMM7_9EURY|nr:hypothetical protein [Archaeoglobus sulfaticallidus]AGK61881.1 hypothetical protein Asulf_01915 [Archaeoglobus sulfaticallidus PM70-1]